MRSAFSQYYIVPAQGSTPSHIPDIITKNVLGQWVPQGYSQAGQTLGIYIGLMDDDDAVSNLHYAFTPLV